MFLTNADIAAQLGAPVTTKRSKEQMVSAILEREKAAEVTVVSSAMRAAVDAFGSTPKVLSRMRCDFLL